MSFKKNYFTLIELLIVVVILAILAGGAIATYSGYDKQAAKGQARNEIARLEAAIRNYQISKGVYPTNFDSLLSVKNSNIQNTAKASFSSSGQRSTIGINNRRGI